MTIFRSTNTYEYRSCPRHGIALSLCVDDTPTEELGHDSQKHDDNRILWHCEKCLAYWNENFFVGGAVHAGVPELRARLILTCTKCGSPKVNHTCVPDCCEEHECEECETSLSAVITLLAPGLPEHEWKRMPAVGRLVQHGGPDKSSGIFRSYRACPRGHAGELELVVFDEAASEINRIGWRCAECKNTFPEVGAFRRWEEQCTPEAQAGALCPHCHGPFLDTEVTSREGTRAVCSCCSAVVSLTLVNAAT